MRILRSAFAIALLISAAASADPLFRNPLPIPLHAGNDRVQLLSADLNRDGFSDLIVVDEDGLQTLLSDGVGPFAPAQQAPRVSPRLVRAATGDFNGDGLADAVVIASERAHTFIGDGRGSLMKGVSFATLWLALAITVADMDGDGHDDVIVGSSILSGGSEVAVHLNDGHGQFAGALKWGKSDEGITRIASADLNRDGRQDLVVGRWSYTEVWLGNGDGTARHSATLAAGFPAVEDLDGDGLPDVAVRAAETVLITRGKGDGTFAPQTSYTVARAESGAPSISVADIDDDGDLDIVTNSGAFVSLLRNRGAAAFEAAVSFVGGPRAKQVVTGDFDRDRKVDVVTLDVPFGDPSLSLIRGNGDGTFAAYRTYDYPAGEKKLSYGGPLVADVNGDGRSDVIGLADHTRSVGTIVNDGSGVPLRYQYSPTHLSTAIGTTGWVAAGDFDRDGVADVVVSNVDSNAVIPMRGVGEGSFLPLRTFQAARDHDWRARAQLVNLNGDGLLDLTVGGYFYAGDGSGLFAPGVSIPSGTYADVNDDGKLDVVEGSYPSLVLWLNDGNARFTRVGVKYYSEFFDLTAVGDFTSDGVVDLLVSLDAGELHLHRGKGDGTFAEPSVFRMDHIDGPCLARDVDRDGLLDLVCGPTIFTGRGDGTFGSVERFRTDAGSSLIGDFDGDGAGEPFLAPFTVLWLARQPPPALETAMTLSASAPAPVYGEALTFSATITAEANLVRTNAILWEVDGAPYALTELRASSASIAPELGAGVHTIIGEYSGDEHHAPSSSTISIVVAKAQTTLTASVSTTQPVPLNALVLVQLKLTHPAVQRMPTGTITFREGSKVLHVADPSAGQVNLRFETLGEHVVDVEYSGDVNFTAASASFTVESSKPLPNGTLVIDPDRPAPGERVLMIVTLPKSATGTVEFSADGQPLGLAVLDNGIAAITHTFGAGLFEILARYSGNATWGALDLRRRLVMSESAELRVNDITVDEGTGGTSSAVFVVELVRPLSSTVTVTYSTAAVSAMEADDFLPVQGTLTFAPGEVRKQVAVTVIADSQPEPGETFELAMRLNFGTTIATCTIRDDDSPARRRSVGR